MVPPHELPTLVLCRICLSGFLKLSRATSAKPALRHCRLEIAQTNPGNSTVPTMRCKQD